MPLPAKLTLEQLALHAFALCAEAAAKETKGRQLDKNVLEVMGLPPDHRVAYTDLYDALTTLKYHGKGWPKGMTEDLYQNIHQEALR